MKEDLHYLKTCPYIEYLKTKHWQKIAKTIRKRDNFKCKLCNRAGSNVHHNNYEHRGKEQKYKEDLITLCDDCHITFHFLREEKESDLCKVSLGKCLFFIVNILRNTKSKPEIVKRYSNGWCHKKYTLEQIINLAIKSKFLTKTKSKYIPTKKGKEFLDYYLECVASGNC